MDISFSNKVYPYVILVIVGLLVAGVAIAQTAVQVDKTGLCEAGSGSVVFNTNTQQYEGCRAGRVADATCDPGWNPVAGTSETRSCTYNTGQVGGAGTNRYCAQSTQNYISQITCEKFYPYTRDYTRPSGDNIVSAGSLAACEANPPSGLKSAVCDSGDTIISSIRGSHSWSCRIGSAFYPNYASKEIVAQVTCGQPEPDVDLCPNLAGFQTSVPSGRVLIDGQCVVPPPPPQAPVLEAGYNEDTHSADLSWNSVPNVDTYIVQRSADGGASFGYLGALPASQTSYNDEFSCSIKKTFFYRVIARAEFGGTVLETYSNVDQVSAIDFLSSRCDALPGPTCSVSPSSVSYDGSATFTATDTDIPGAVGMKVRWFKNGQTVNGCSDALAFSNPSCTTASLETNVSAGQYSYGLYEADDINRNNPTILQTISCPGVTVGVALQPINLSIVSARATSPTTIEVTWQNPSNAQFGTVQLWTSEPVSVGGIPSRDKNRFLNLGIVPASKLQSGTISTHEFSGFKPNSTYNLYLRGLNPVLK